MEKVVVPEKKHKNVFFDYIYDIVREVNPDYQIDVDDSLEEFQNVEKSVKIEVVPYISTEVEIALISLYVQKYFTPNEAETFGYLKPSQYDYWQAEFSVVQGILDSLTNIDVTETKPDELFEIFYLVINVIENYYQFRKKLKETVKAIENSKSIGSVIDNLSNKLFEILESLKSVNTEELAKVGKDLLTQIESSPISEVFVSTKR